MLFSRRACAKRWTGSTARSANNALSAGIATRGPWIMLLLAAIVLVARLTRAVASVVVSHAGGRRPALAAALAHLLAPMILTPLILRVVPTDFLPVLVADYLVAHFFVYGLLTALLLAFASRGQAGPLRADSAGAFSSRSSRLSCSTTSRSPGPSTFS